MNNINKEEKLMSEYERDNINKEEKLMRKVLILLVFVIVLVLVGISVVNGADKVKIGVSYDALQAQYWLANLKGIEDEAEKLDVDLIVVTAEGDTTKQLYQIENLISRGVDAIICAPRDSKAIVSAIKKANEAGIPFLTNNRGADPGARVAIAVGMDSGELAMQEAQWLVEKAKKENKKYKVLELLGDMKDLNAIDRDVGFTKVAEENSDVMEIVAQVPTDWQPEKALTGTINLLQSNRDINCIFIPSDSLLPPVISALQQSDLYFKSDHPDHVTVATFDGAKEAVDAIEEGYVDIVAVQDAVFQGNLLVQGAVELARGEELTFEDTERYELIKGEGHEDIKINQKGFFVTQENFEEKAHLAWGSMDLK